MNCNPEEFKALLNNCGFSSDLTGKLFLASGTSGRAAGRFDFLGFVQPPLSKEPARAPGAVEERDPVIDAKLALVQSYLSRLDIKSPQRRTTATDVPYVNPRYTLSASAPTKPRCALFGVGISFAGTTRMATDPLTLANRRLMRDPQFQALLRDLRATLRQPGTLAPFTAVHQALLKMPPSVETVVRRPERAARVPPKDVPALLARLAAAQSALVARLQGQRLRSPSAVAEGLLTEAQLCAALHVSREAVLRLRRDPVDPIPCMRAGRRFLYDLERVKAWMERRAGRARPRVTRRPGRWRPRRGW